MNNYPKDLRKLIDKDKVNVIRTPKSVFQAQLVAWDVLTKRLRPTPTRSSPRWSTRRRSGPRTSSTTGS